MARIEGVDPDRAQGPIKAVFEAQTKKWGAQLSNHLLYARRPTIFHRSTCGKTQGGSDAE